MDLDSLLIQTQGLIPSRVEELGRTLYEEHYSGTTYKTHDGEEIKFFADRFDHAFYGKPEATSKSKVGIDAERVTRIMWIRELIEGQVPDSECLLVEHPGRLPGRLYIINSEMYVVWLEGLKTGWKFSTAYKAYGFQIKKYRKQGHRIWKYGWKEKCPVIVGPTGPEAKSAP